MEGGVLSRAGHTEAACDLAKLAGLQSAGVICEIMNDDGTMASRDDLIKLLFNKYRIKCVIQYYPLNRYDLFVKRGYGSANVPNTDEFYDNMISFPFSITLSENDIDYLIDSIISAIFELNSK